MILLVCLALSAGSSLAQADGSPQTLVQPDLAIEKWQGGARCAISLTFDDATLDHWDRGMALWEEFGYRVTMGIITSTFEDNPLRYRQLQQAFEAGHELANHTTTHPDLTQTLDWELRQELKLCNDMLLSKVRGLKRVDTVIYPYEQFDERVMGELAKQGFLFARSGQQGVVDTCQLNDPFAPNFLGLYSWANQAELPLWMWNSTTDWAVEHGGWLVEQCHGIGTKGEKGVGWSARPESDFRAHYEHMKTYGDQLWVAPISDVGRYIMQRNNARITVLRSDEEHVVLRLEQTLDPKVFDVPLTIAYTPPLNWKELSVSRGGQPIPHSVTSLVRFDAVPGNEEIIIRRVR